MPYRVLLLTEEQGHGGVQTVLGQLQDELHARGWQIETACVRDKRPRFLALLKQARQAQVLIASNNFSPAYWAVFLGLLTHRPSVVWVHGPLAQVLRQQPVSWIKRQLLRWTCVMADRLVFASRASRDSLHEQIAHDALPPQAVIHNPAPELSEAPCTPTRTGVALGYVGRLSEEKRPHLLLHMLCHLPEDHHLTLVGDGPLLPQLQQLASELGLTARNRVHFAGARTVCADTYQSWQLTLLCSAYEGYPMAALESLAAGVPCLSTPMAALQEMLGPQAVDWLAADEQAQSLARTVLRVLQTAPSQRRALAHDLARPHSRAAFGQHWHEELLRSLRQPLHGTARTVHFVHAGPAYMPELFAYETHLTALGHHTRRHSHPATVPVDADIVWWMCGRVSADHSHRLRRSLHVHEYASASVGRWPAVKDLIKRWSHPRPDHRIFLNEWVRERMGFDDGVPCSLRDMGVPPAFLHAQATQPADHDLVYLGEMGRLRSFLPVLQLLSQAGIRLLLIGQLPDDLARQVQSLPHIQCTGRLPQEDVPQQLLRARAGLNLMPNQMPLSMQTSTKVLEYLATGLPVLSNAYPWAQQMASEYPERVRLLNDLTSSGDWLQALSALPPCQADRSSMHHLAWPVRLARLPAWEQLGLVKVSA